MQRTHCRSARRPNLESLEDRRLLSTFTVENTNSSGTGSLALAIGSADADRQANTITFDPNVFATPQTITVGGTVPLVLTDSSGLQTVTGPEAGVTIKGNGQSVVFEVANGVTATLSGLTITNGNGRKGGALYNTGTVTLTDCTISGNSADYGGGVDNYAGTATLTGCTISGNSAGFAGGAVYCKLGTTTLTDCTISGNSATQECGGVTNGGTAMLADCTISGNSAKYGGGVYNFDNGTATLTDCTISGNSASIRGGGLDNGGTATLTDCTISGNSSADGGGVYNSFHKATLTGTIVAGNSDQSVPDDIGGFAASAVTGSFNLIGSGGSGGIVNGSQGNIVLTSLTNLGLAPLGDFGGATETMALLPGSPALGKGTAADYPGTTTPITTDQRGFPVDAPNPDIGAFQGVNLEVESTSGSVDMQPSSLTLPGAISLANSLERTTITFDPAVFAMPQTITLAGSALELSNAGSTTSIMSPAAGVTISGAGQSSVFALENGASATLSGLTITDGNSRFGGGVDNLSGTATLTDCTLTGNSAGSNGGGVYNGLGTTTLTDCTISGNSAGSGGGVDNSAGTVMLTDCTISGNSGSDGGVYNGGTATLTGTIVAGNTNPSGASDIGGPTEVSGSSSNNLIGIGGAGGLTNGTTNNIVLTSLAGLGLAPLGFYGGPTQTIALLPGSAAIGAGIAVGGLTTDQRGLPRIVDGVVDIGAFESSGFSLAITTGNDQSTSVGTAFPNALQVTVTPKNAGDPVNGGVVTFTPPASGPGATLNPSAPVTIASGSASVMATANGTAGDPYLVTAATTGASSVSFTLTNNPAGSYSTLVSLGSSESLSTYGQPVTFTATVNNASASGGIPTGSVEFFDGTTDLGAGTPLSGSGTSAKSTFTAAGLPAGADSISALYTATGGFDGGTGTLGQTVNPAVLTVSGLTAANKVYNASTAATLNTSSATLVGVFSGDTVNLNTGAATGAFASENTGTGITVTVAGLTIVGAQASDYTLSEPTTTADITPAPLTVSGITAANKVYNASTAATLNTSGATLVGVFSGDLVSLDTGSATGTFASQNVGTGITVTVAGLTIVGAQSGNYTLTQPTTTASITPTATPRPMIISEQALIVRKTSKKGKPVGKPVLGGYVFDFSSALDPSSAANSGNYQVDNVVSKRVKKKVVSTLHPITSFNASYSNDVVTIKFAGKQAFKTGGQITVLSGVTSPSGAALQGTTVFTISKGGKGITPS